jgi:diguanylate cyclase (GGDEF)-like protein
MGLRFMGIRARLLLLYVVAALAGAFCLLPLIPSRELAGAYPRIALVVGIGSLLAAWIGRGLVRPLERLERTLRQRLLGREVMPPQDAGLDEVHDLSESLGRFLAHCDQKDAQGRGVTSGVDLDGDRELRTLLTIARGLPGTDGAPGAVQRLLSGVREHLGLGHLSLLIQDDRSGQLELFAGAGLEPALLAEVERHGPRPVKFAEGVGVAGICLQTGRTKVAPRGHRDKDFARLGGEYESLVRSLACVPVRRDGKVVGVLNAVNISRAGGFDLGAIEFLEEAARMAEAWLPSFLGEELSEDLDPLSGVLRFDVWEDRLDSEIERHRRFPRGLAVAVVELDYLGEEALGPERNGALSEVGLQIRRSLRGLDAVAREGDRFFVVLPETDLLGAIHLSGRIKDMVDRSALGRPGEPPRYVALVGVAACPEVVDDPVDLVGAAEDAVVASRRAGDHRLSCYRRKVA